MYHGTLQYYIVILMSEMTPGRIALFEDSVDAWIQVACPRLSIDWGDAFHKPVLTPFEAEIALGFVSGWWERNLKTSSGCVADSSCSEGDSGCECGSSGASKCDDIGDYPMDYYAQDGGEWNSSYVKKSSRPAQRILVHSADSSSIASHWGALSQITNAASSGSSSELVFWLIEHVVSSNKTSSGMSNLLFDVFLPGRSNDTIPGHKYSE